MTATVKNSTVEIARVCANVWEEIRKNHPDVPEVVWGEDSVRAILVDGDGVRRDAIEVFEALLREAAHGLAVTRGIKDTSREGRFFNTRFKALAEEVGLTVTQDSTSGWSVTESPETTWRRYGGATRGLDGMLREYQVPDKPATTKKRLGPRCRCAEPRSFQIYESVLARGPITCGVCGAEFTSDTEEDQ